jgi:hypothetical protein
MSLAVLLCELPELLVEQVIIGEEAIAFAARLILPAMPCPGCAQLATRVHSRSRLVPRDLPASGLLSPFPACDRNRQRTFTRRNRSSRLLPGVFPGEVDQLSELRQNGRMPQAAGGWRPSLRPFPRKQA